MYQIQFRRWGAYSAPRPLAGLRWPIYAEGREREGKGRGPGKEGTGSRGKEGTGRGA